MTTENHFEIREEDLSHRQVLALLAYHLEQMERISPEGNFNALPEVRLREPDVTCWSIWEGQTLCGLFALKELAPDHGEVKSLRTAPGQEGRGIGTIMLRYLVEEARRRGYKRLSLETGRTEPYGPARALYKRHGFAECPPFGDYKEDGFSLCMTREV